MIRTADITAIIDNDEGLHEEAYHRCVNVLTNYAGINVLEDEYVRKNRGYEYYELCASEIQDMIKEVIGYDSSESDAKTSLMRVLLNEIDWYAIGEHYYDTTVSRWEYEHDV